MLQRFKKTTTGYTDDTDQKMIHEQLSREIIGAAMQVLNELKPGLDEKLYERALTIELATRGHIVSVQRSFPVFYRGQLIGDLIPDLIVEDAVIVDPKVVACFTETHIAQMIGVSKHYRPRSCSPDQFQEPATRMETRVASTPGR